MQRNTKQIADFFCVTTSLLVSSTLNATALPPINISLSSGTGSNLITTSIGSTSIVEYELHDNIGRPPARTWLWSDPIPPYITRTQSLHQPDCSLYSTPGNPNMISLPPNGTCYFALQVDGTGLASVYQGSTINYRPMFINSNGVAYGPCSSEILKMALTTLPPQPQPPPPLPLLLAVGKYFNGGTLGRPLLIESQDSGTSWIYPESTTSPLFDMPTLGSGAAFNGSSCGANTCIAVGRGEDDYANVHPILALTHDAGTTWSYTPIDPPWFVPDPDASATYFGSFTAASCSGNTCIAVGNDQDMSLGSNPILAVSQNSGVTWMYPPSIHTPIFTAPDTNPYGDSGSFLSASCSGSTCIAVGDYTDSNSDKRPLLALSQDAGITWTYPDSITSPTFVNNPYASDANFSSASCSGSTCIAVGSYIDTNGLQRPLLARTQDSGTTWAFIDSITTPETGTYTFKDGGSLNSATCYGTTCIAGGAYIDENDMVRNLLTVSLDSATTWTYPDSIQNVAGVWDFFGKFGGIQGTNCYGTLCVAVGQIAGPTSNPFVATSQDSGATWAYVTAMETPDLPTNPYVENGELNSVACNASACIASGKYTSTSERHPLVALGLNNGGNWSYPDSVTSPVFTPNDTYPFGSGELPSSSASWINWLAHPPTWVIPNSPSVLKK